MPHQEIYDQFFGKNDNNDPKASLQKVVQEYPYFSLPHFFLLKETIPTDFNYRKIAAKTALHFNNPFFLKFQLYRKENLYSMEEDKVEPAPVPVNADKIYEEKLEDVHEIAEVEVAESKEIAPIETAVVGGLPAASEENESTVGVNTENSDADLQTDVALELPQNTAPGVENIDGQPESAQKPEISGNSASVEPNLAGVENKDTGEQLLFEPLHTTDYFASQGIKLSEEVQTGDKLGKQLKSFTDWLKTMKKVHQGKLPENTRSIDLAVQTLAEKSNREQEIITESMADVFVQQGKTDKAHELYKKLSLLNPAKSAYFAAKIELLKEN